MFGARFFDPSFTFVERGVSFLVLGIIVLGINALYFWRKRKQRAKMNQRIRQARQQSIDKEPEVLMGSIHEASQDILQEESDVTVKEEER